MKQSVDEMAPQEHHALISALSALSAGEVSLICQEVIGDMKRLQMHPKHASLKSHWVYAICRQALTVVHLGDAFAAFTSGDISEYHLWLQLDAISARAVMNEVSESQHQARSDINAVTRLVKSFSVSVDSIPASCRSTILMACCRLPFIERSLQLYAESVASFRLCVSNDSSVVSYIPIPVQIALSMEAGEMMLKLACVPHLQTELTSGPPREGGGDREEKGGTESVPSLEETQLHIDNAHSLLMNAKTLLSSGASAARGNRTQRRSEPPEESSLDTLPPLSLHPLSIHWLLPTTPSDPDRLVEGVSSGRLAVSLAAASL